MGRGKLIRQCQSMCCHEIGIHSKSVYDHHMATTSSRSLQCPNHITQQHGLKPQRNRLSLSFYGLSFYAVPKKLFKEIQGASLTCAGVGRPAGLCCIQHKLGAGQSLHGTRACLSLFLSVGARHPDGLTQICSCYLGLTAYKQVLFSTLLNNCCLTNWGHMTWRWGCGLGLKVPSQLHPPLRAGKPPSLPTFHPPETPCASPMLRLVLLQTCWLVLSCQSCCHWPDASSQYWPLGCTARHPTTMNHVKGFQTTDMVAKRIAGIFINLYLYNVFYQSILAFSIQKEMSS